MVGHQLRLAALVNPVAFIAQLRITLILRYFSLFAGYLEAPGSRA
jgi:hypothetical protein